MTYARPTSPLYADQVGPRIVAAWLNWVDQKDRETLSVLDYGAVGDGATDDTAAIQAAQAAATAAGKALLFPTPPVKYIYKPAATLFITTDWLGESPDESIIEVDTSLFSGVYFQITDRALFRDLQIACKGGAKVGTGLRISTADPADFVAHVTLTRLWVFGFAKNVDQGQLIWTQTEQCRFENGTEGWYCAPTGYFTTLTHIGSVFRGNVRNYYCAPTVNSDVLNMLGVTIESASGATHQSFFINVREMFLNGYFEGAPTIPAIDLGGVSLECNGLFLNGTGGITTRVANNQLSLANVYTTSVTDVLAITASANVVECNLRQCQFPASGNDISGIDRGTLTNVLLNGTQYQFHVIGALSQPITAITYSASMTPNAALGNDFTITATNNTAFTVNAPTGGKAGQSVTITIRNTSGGALGAVTWGAGYKLAAWVSPATANSRSITFRSDGTNWIEIGRTTADVPN